MEDSIEDYIRILNNTKDLKVDDERKKMLLLTTQRKKECEEYSQKIVEFLIEGQLRLETFVRCLRHINQELYQDIIEERAITKICGYPLCGINLPEMPKKQYYISRKKNKIYDITDRKNYCCNFCYKASVHIKNQIETSPLWLRKAEECPNFNLLPYSKLEGLPGEEMDYGIAKTDEEVNFTSVSNFSEYSLNEIDELEMDSREKQREEQNMRNNKKYKNKIRNVKQYVSICEEDEETSDDCEGINEENDEYDAESYKYDCDETNDDYKELNSITDALKRSKLFGEASNVNNLPNISNCIRGNEHVNNINEQILEFKQKLDDTHISDGNESDKKLNIVIKGKTPKRNLDEKLKSVIEKCKNNTSNQKKTIVYTDPLPITSSRK